MKTNYMIKTAAVLAVSGLVWSGSTALAQPAAGMATPAPAVSPPPLAYGVPQVLQLAQAKVSDETIITFIRNSGTSYGLTADQIIYLRQQGVSEAVITAMLNQPKPGVAAAPQPAGTTITTANGSTATVAPTVTYVQPAPVTTYYYADPYYYPAYGYVYPYPAVSIGFGWGWHGGYGGWHGGYGGWHGGGHGGWNH